MTPNQFIQANRFYSELKTLSLALRQIEIIGYLNVSIGDYKVITYASQSRSSNDYREVANVIKLVIERRIMETKNSLMDLGMTELEKE